MSTITRSALVFWGRNPPPELAYLTRRHMAEPFRMVTWDEVMDAKRKRQSEILEHKRDPGPQRRPWMVWVFYNDTDIYGGWHCYLIRYDENGKWLMRPSQELMRLFPLVLPLGDIRDQWHNWKVEFARQYKRRMHHGKPEGMTPVWWDGWNGEIELAKERTANVQGRATARVAPTE